jgi:tetratricopeptide (TPR) repeat protein
MLEYDSVDSFSEHFFETNKECQEVEPNPFLPMSALKERKKVEIFDFIKSFAGHIQKGYLILRKLYQEEISQNVDQSEKLINFLGDLFFQDNKDFINNSKDDDMSLSDILQIDTQSIKNAYQLGLKLIEQNAFEEASEVFYFLLTISPNIAILWTALGYSYQNLNQSEKASNAYLMAHALDPSNVEPLFFAIEMLVEMKDFSGALQCLSFIETQIKEKQIVDENNSYLNRILDVKNKCEI